MNLSEIRQRVWRRLGEDASDPLRYTAEIVDEVINDGVQLFLARMGSKIATTTLTQRAGQLWYNLPSDCIRVQSVRRVTTDDALLPIDWRDLDDAVTMRKDSPYQRFDGLRRRWTDVTDAFASSYLIFGMNEIALWPLLSTGTDTYTVTYTEDVGETSLVNDGDSSGLPFEYEVFLVDYAAGRLLLPGARGQALQEAQTATGRFMSSVDLGGQRKGSLARTWTSDPGGIAT